MGNAKMKVVHVVPGVDVPTNGIANAAKRIAAEQRALGHDVRLTGCALTDAEARWADVVFVHSMFSPIEWISCRRASRAKTKLVRMPHGCLDPIRFRYRWWKKVWTLPFELLSFWQSDAVYATCEAEVRWVRWLRRPVIMIPLGVDVDCTRMTATAATSVSATGSQARTAGLALLCLGRLHPLKGVDCLIEAVARVSGVRLEIVGGDEKGLRGEYEALAARLGASDRVAFLGELTMEEKDGAFDRCDLFVLPTRSENFGIVIGEAYAHRKPVVTTDGASSWEGISRRGIGWYLAPYARASQTRRIQALVEALEAAKSVASRLPQMGEAGCAWVRERFDWRVNVSRLMEEVSSMTCRQRNGRTPARPPIDGQRP